MAYHAKYSDLSKDQLSLILQGLTLQPVNKEAEKYLKYKPKSGFSSTPTPPVGFYKALNPDAREQTLAEKDKNGKLEDTHIAIPFRFACGVMGKIVNRHITFPRVFDEGLDRPYFAITLLERQVDVAKELYQQLCKYSTTIMGLPPGWGKTIVGSWLWHMTATVLCVLIPATALITSWLNTMNLCFPRMKDRVWVVGQTQMPENVAIIICMNERYMHVPEFIRKQVGCLIIDEAHLFCTRGNVDCLLYFTPKFVIGMTATLERENDGMEVMAHAICGTHGVFKISDKPHTVIRLRTFMHVPEETNARGKDYGKMLQKLSVLQERNNQILEIIWNNRHRKFMVLTKLVEHAKYLVTAISSMGIQCASLYGNQKTYSDSPVLVGITKKIGTGFDEAQFCPDYGGKGSDVLIFCFSVRAKASYEQQRGRIRAENGIIIYLVDENDAPKKHFKELKPWMIETNGTIVEMDYSPGAIRLPALPEKVVRQTASSTAAAQPQYAQPQAQPSTVQTQAVYNTSTFPYSSQAYASGHGNIYVVQQTTPLTYQSQISSQSVISLPLPPPPGSFPITSQ